MKEVLQVVELKRNNAWLSREIFASREMWSTSVLCCYDFVLQQALASSSALLSYV